MLKRIALRSIVIILRYMLSIRLFILITCSSLTVSIIWMQVADNYSVNSLNENLIKEALENGARDYRYAEVYRRVDKLPSDIKYMLLWTRSDLAPFYYFGNGQRKFIENNCSQINCFITTDRNFFNDGGTTKFDAIAFNGRSLKDIESDIPRKRSSHQKYIFFNMESSDNYPVCNYRFNDFFNWTATYKLNSDIPFPYIQIKNRHGEIIGPRDEIRWPVIDKTYNEEYDYRQNKSKAIAWFVSHCKSRSGRKKYAVLLQKALKPLGWTVDIYGRCGPLKCPRSLKNNCDMILERDYYFYLSFENSKAEDYVTEKLLTALQHNVVPIVLGGADYKRFLPPGSYIDATTTSPEKLATKINEVIKSADLYNGYFKWKTLYTYSDPSSSDCVCAMCAALNNITLVSMYSSYQDFRSWWNPDYRNRCRI